MKLENGEAARVRHSPIQSMRIKSRIKTPEHIDATQVHRSPRLIGMKKSTTQTRRCRDEPKCDQRILKRSPRVLKETQSAEVS